MASLRDLDDRYWPFASQLFRIMHAYDSRFVITSARRTPQQQQQLYDRMLKAKAAGEPYFLTNRPGTSQHERGMAIDVVRFGIDPRQDELLAAFGAAWRAAGGVWGGVNDPVHFGAPSGW